MSHTKTVIIDNTATDAAYSTNGSAGLALAVNDTVTASGSWPATIANTNNLQFFSPFGSSKRFNCADIVSTSYNAYSAGTAQTITITMVAATTYARDEDGTYSLKLIDVTDGREKFVMKTFQTQAYTADQNGETIADAFVALVEAEGDRADSPFYNVSAAAGTDGVLVITFPVNQFARAASTDSLPAPTYNAAAPSIGTVADVNADFEDALPFQGVTNIAGPNVVKPAGVAGTGNYDKYVIFVKETVGMREDIHEIVIYAEDTNATGIAALTALLDVD